MAALPWQVTVGLLRNRVSTMTASAAAILSLHSHAFVAADRHRPPKLLASLIFPAQPGLQMDFAHCQ
jgi:hypothetical protein